MPTILTDPALRYPLPGSGAQRAVLAGFWEWYDGLSPASRSAAVGPVLNKLRAILARPFAARLLGSSRSSFSVTDVLDGGLLLARLPKGLLGEDTARLVGSLLVARVWQAATARADRPPAARPDAALYVDECHNFLALPGALDDVLAEARGYHLSLVLAHQHLGQLPPDLADAVSANARNKIYFTVSPEDARRLARHVGPVLGEYDLCHLGGYQIACRLVADGVDTTGFTLRTVPLPAPVRGRATALRQAARAHGHSAEARRTEELRRRRGHRDRANSGTDSGTVPPGGEHQHNTSGGGWGGGWPGGSAGGPPGVPHPPGSPAAYPPDTGGVTPASRDADSWWSSS